MVYNLTGNHGSLKKKKRLMTGRWAFMLIKWHEFNSVVEPQLQVV